MAASQGTLFHATGWLQAQAAAHALRLERFGFYRNGDMVGIAPVLVNRTALLRVGASPFVLEDTPYAGLAVPDEVAVEAFGALRYACRRAGIHFLRLVQDREYHLATGAEVRVIQRHTHRLDVTPPTEALWANLEGRCRTAVRKAEKSGVTITVETTDAWIDPFYDLLRSLYTSQGLGTPNPKRFYTDLWPQYGGQSLHALMARLDGRLIAGALLGMDATRGYYLSGASDPEFNSLSPNNLLQWHAICHCKEHGCPSYDFVGSDIPRLAKFKASFGGALVAHSVVETASYGFLWKLRKAYPRIKQLRRRLRETFADFRSGPRA